MQKPRNSKKAKEYYNIQETPKAQAVQKTDYLDGKIQSPR